MKRFLRNLSLTRDLPYALLCCIFTIFYLNYVSPGSLLPTNVSWLAEGDLRQHYLGWLAYRHEESAGEFWGQSQLLAYPYGAPISATDSNPLLSFFWGSFSRILPNNFQFIGLTYFINLALSIWFAFKLVAHIGFDRITAAVFAGVLAFQPIVFWRFGHDTLTSQWLILAHIYVCLACQGPVRSTFGHGVLLAIAILVHPYLFVMNALIVGFDLLVKVFSRRGLRWGNLEMATMLVALATLVAVYFGKRAGVFALKNPYKNEIGVFSTDVLGFFNPFDTSRVLSQLPAADGQYEGYSYLGLGGLVIVAVAILLALRGKATQVVWGHYMAISLAVIVSFLIALGPTVSVLGKPLFAVDLSDNSPIRMVLEKLRSHGRFVWLVCYAVVFWAIAMLPRARPVMMRAFAVAILALQLWDTAPLRDRTRALTADKPLHAGMFETTAWIDRIATADFVYLSDKLPNDLIFDIAQVAFPRQVPLSRFYTAQDLGLPEQLDAAADLSVRTLNGDIAEDVLYLVDNAFEVPLLHQNATSLFATSDGGNFSLILNKQSGDQLPDSDLSALIRECTEGCSMMIVSQGDASAYFPSTAKGLLRAAGGHPDAISSAGTYAAIVQNGRIIAEAVESGKSAQLNEMIGEVAVSLSAEPVAGGKSVIRVGGRDFGRDKDGIAILQLRDNSLLVSAVFDEVIDPTEPEDVLGTNDQVVAEFVDLDYGFYQPLSRAEPFLDFERYLSKDSTLFEVLTKCQIGCSMAISVKDEATAALPREVRQQAGRMGLALAELEFRDGFAAIIEDGIVLVQARSHTDLIEISENSQGRQVAVKSAGFEGGNLSSISLDGQELSLSRRGINIVVFNGAGQEISFHFDTHGAS